MSIYSIAKTLMRNNILYKVVTAFDKTTQGYYHAAPVSAVTGIIKSNFVMMSTQKVGGGTADIDFTHYPFYLSLTRMRFGGYSLRNSDNAIIVFDYKLKNRFKIVAYDYWTRSTRKSAEEMGNISYMMEKYEAEDRLLSTKPKLNLLPYIKSVHILYSSRTAYNIRKLLEALEHNKTMLNNGTQFWLYMSPKHHKVQATKFAKNLLDIRPEELLDNNEYQKLEKENEEFQATMPPEYRASTKKRIEDNKSVIKNTFKELMTEYKYPRLTPSSHYYLFKGLPVMEEVINKTTNNDYMNDPEIEKMYATLGAILKKHQLVNFHALRDFLRKKSDAAALASFTIKEYFSKYEELCEANRKDRNLRHIEEDTDHVTIVETNKQSDDVIIYADKVRKKGKRVWIVHQITVPEDPRKEYDWIDDEVRAELDSNDTPNDYSYVLSLLGHYGPLEFDGYPSEHSANEFELRYGIKPPLKVLGAEDWMDDILRARNGENINVSLFELKDQIRKAFLLSARYKDNIGDENFKMLLRDVNNDVMRMEDKKFKSLVHEIFLFNDTKRRWKL